MFTHKNIRFFIPVLICLAILVGACDNSTPTPQNLPYYPGCSVSNLITQIEFANNLAGPDVINLDPNCVYTLTQVDNSASVDGSTIHNGLPVISSEITIQGNMAIVDIQRAPGEPSFGHFYVDPSGDLALYDLTLSNGLRQLGGAVIVFEGDFFASSTYFIENGVGPMDMNNIIPGRGGAIYNESGRVRIINNSIFLRNYASQPSIQGGDLGGAIYSKNGVLTVSSSTFDANSSAGRGGAIYAEKDLSDTSGGLVIIDGSSFISNRAVQDGGAISLINEANGVFITGSDFSYNQADGSGGAIFSEASDLTASFGTFEVNTATLGGAIFSKRPAEGGLSSLTSERSIYNHNTAAVVGGAIFSENSDLTIDNSDFDDNTANSCGAIRNGGSPSLDVEAGDLETALRIPSDSRIIDSSFYYNEALVNHGGAICHVMGEMLVKRTTIFGNQAFDSGGGMIVHDQTEIIGSHFAANTAWNGGALLIGYPVLDRLEPNNSEYSVYPDYMTFHTAISTSIFAANQADQTGGGIYAHHEGTTSINKSLFQNNTAHAGGGILRRDGKMFINNSTFSANSASRGGGIRAYDQVNSRLGIKHTTFAFNTATETSNGGNVYNVAWGGGALNVGYNTTVENSLIYQNSPMDCQITNGSNYSSTNTYDSDSTCSLLTEPNPQIGPLLNHGGGTKTHALLPGSPLIDILPDCAGMTEDQRGVTRPQGSACDPGAYEFDPDNPPEEWLWEEISLTPEPDDSSDNCLPFEGLEISVILLNVPADTLVLPLYFKFPDGVPGQDEGELWVYRALLGEIESYNCGLQGFDDRLYCMFNLPPGAPGLALDLKLFVGNCEDPAYSQPKVTIPMPKVTIPMPQCHADLKEEACKAAGGIFYQVSDTQSICDCP